MKRLSICFISLVLLFTLAGCGNPAGDIQGSAASPEANASLGTQAPAPTEPAQQLTASESRSNDEYDYDVYVDHVVITDYHGSSSDVVIPDTIDGLPVTRLGTLSFASVYDDKNISSVVIPDSVEIIGMAAFTNNRDLTEIDLPAHLTSIGPEAFASTGLTQITIPDGISAIQLGTFRSCRSLTSVILPNGIQEIDTDAFYGTPWLDSLTEEFVIVGDGVLLDYNGAGGDVVIPNTVKYISSAFCFSDAAPDITSVTIPGSVTCIGNSAFGNCTGLTAVTIPDSVTRINDNAFIYCANLTSIALPGGLTYIGERAFAQTGLTKIVIPDSVSIIDDGAFGKCSDLSEVTIPDSVTHIGSRAFEGTPWLDSNTDEFIIVGDGVLLDYNGAGGDVVIPDTVKYISSAMYGCSVVTSVRIPSSVTEIGSYAFHSCFFLTNVTLPDSVEKIASNAFDNFDRLRFICSPDSFAAAYAEEKGISLQPQ